MRQIVVDHARAKTQKRGRRKVSLDEAIDLPDGRNADLCSFEAGLKALERVDTRKCQVIERYFGGLSIDEIAEALNLSSETVRRDLTYAARADDGRRR